MHFGFKRFLSAGIAAMMSMLMLAPAVQAAEEMADQNGDGVIDVFDYVLSKRATVTESSPADISLASVEGNAGGLVSVSAAISNNPGFSRAKFIIDYSAELEIVIQPDSGDFIGINSDSFPALEMTAVNAKKLSQLTCFSTQRSEITGDGILFNILFRIPENAEPGTTYSIFYHDAELYSGSESMPMLVERGKITVTDEPAGQLILPITAPETTTAETTTTTETTTTSTVTTTTTAATTAAPAATTAATTATSATAAATTATSATAAETTATSATAAETTAAATEITSATDTTAAETTAETTTTFVREGIDISAWQGDVNFNEIKSDPNVEFAILRAGFGRELDQEDRMFRTYYDAAKAVGMPVGAYWYSYADTPEAARIEANVCAQVLGDRKFEYPIAFDIEEPYVLAKPMEEISAIILAFCTEMEKKGYFVQIYCSSFYLNNKIAKYLTTEFDVWVAHYNVEAPTYTGPYGIWQYGIGSCKGVYGDVDVDHCYRDYPALIKEKHTNGY